MSKRRIPVHKQAEDDVMTLDVYQLRAANTAVYPNRMSMMGLMYCGLKLSGEAGEFADKLGKVLRDDHGEVSRLRREMLIKELGDVLWYVSQAAIELNIRLDEVGKQNLEKLRDRHERGVIKGDGDNR
jgi:NTP pyrophosphatase (non-canonical NTP hydrolase)